MEEESVVIKTPLHDNDTDALKELARWVSNPISISCPKHCPIYQYGMPDSQRDNTPIIECDLRRINRGMGKGNG